MYKAAILPQVGSLAALDLRSSRGDWGFRVNRRTSGREKMKPAGCKPGAICRDSLSYADH